MVPSASAVLKRVFACCCFFFCSLKHSSLDTGVVKGTTHTPNCANKASVRQKRSGFVGDGGAISTLGGSSAGTTRIGFAATFSSRRRRFACPLLSTWFRAGKLRLLATAFRNVSSAVAKGRHGRLLLAPSLERRHDRHARQQAGRCHQLLPAKNGRERDAR